MAPNGELHDPSLLASLKTALSSPELRAPDGSLDLQSALRWAHSSVGPLHGVPADATARVAKIIATSAWLDMGFAFCTWSHRMVLEYLAAADDPKRHRATRERLESAELIGTTALAAAIAHHVTGAPLPITAQRQANNLSLDGRVRWASNLYENDYLVITVADCGGHPCVVSIPAGTPGLTVDPFPELIELQPTRSSSLRMTKVALTDEAVVARNFDTFIRHIRPRFLLLQSSFCWGLAARALHEASGLLTGINELFASDLRELQQEHERLGTTLRDGLAALTTATPPSARDTVKIRLELGQLAGAATRFEAKLIGGAGYLKTSESARRVREASFLPVQSPTEGLLRWELSRSS